MMKARLPLLLVLGAAACGETSAPPAGPPDGIVSGSRLRARFLQSPDGPRQFRGFRDTLLDADCNFQIFDETAVPRCLPDIAWPSAYADDACTIPLATQATVTCEAPPAFVGRPTDVPCQGGWDTVWAVGAVVTPATIHVRDNDGACVEAPPVGDVTYREVGAEITLDGFVAATVVHDDTARRIEVQRLVGADGASIPWSNYDDQLDVACSLWDIGRAGVDRCVPRITGHAGWVDDACSSPVISTQPECAARLADYILAYQPDGCEVSYRLFERGAEIEPTVIYADRADACEPQVATEDYIYVDAGRELALDALASAQRALDDDGAQRLRGYWLTGDDGFRQPGWGVHDTELGLDCSVDQMADGSYRCVPVSSDATEVRYFDDADCTAPVVIVEHRIDPCDPDATVATLAPAWLPREDGCTYQMRLYEVGAARTAPLYERVDDACVPLGVADDVVRYQVGAEVPDTALVEYTEVIE